MAVDVEPGPQRLDLRRVGAVEVVIEGEPDARVAGVGVAGLKRPAKALMVVVPVDGDTAYSPHWLM